ncbi:Type 1 glutamine amidotransferase-like domain-containing protein [Neomicrococcus aestuarii]|uniref:Peptidase S51 n=1 Tax=Neomicrococcus aestuarii TaxID=556325 RepID=A0A1L2ZM65_9MICC|nr:Type 1 glutamine amidotransferase-like domain-containing protein [Neomicrococcus aestuarii]APF40118.1 peptidase S51 [Neomicrococcus aestuarii]
MKLLLTSGGITNDSIREALESFLGKSIYQSSALCIPTAQYGHPWCTPQSMWNFVAGEQPSHMTGLGWKSVGLLELLALPSMKKERWLPWLEAADVLLVDGGDAIYLRHWLAQSGLWDELQRFPNLVWVGVSAGSMVLTPRVGREFMTSGSKEIWGREDLPAPADAGLGAVEFSIFPHLNHPDMPTNTLQAAEKWFEQIDHPAFAMDDDSAIVVVDGDIRVISEGTCVELG